MDALSPPINISEAGFTIGLSRGITKVTTINNEDINDMLDNYLMVTDDEDDEERKEKAKSAKKLQTLYLVLNTEQRTPQYKQIMDKICEWLYHEFLPKSGDITAKDALQNMKQRFKDPSSDIPLYFSSKQESGFFSRFDTYFDDFLQIEADIYQIIYEIVVKMIYIESVSESYPMFYFPLTWSTNLNTDFLRCFGFGRSPLKDDDDDDDDEDDQFIDDVDQIKRKRFLSQFRVKFFGKKTVKELGDRKNARCSGCRRHIHRSKQGTVYIWRRVPFIENICDNHELIFHDEYCILLRKYKEAIRQYIFEYELGAKLALKHREIPDLNDDTRLFYLYRDRNSILAVDSGKTKDELPQPTKHVFIQRKRRLSAAILMDDLYYELHEDDRNIKEFAKHELLLYIDVHVYGIALWRFCVKQLEIKNRDGLWNIMNHLAAHLTTLSVLNELEDGKDSFKRFEVNSLNVLCQTVIKNAQFPAATALYLAGFMSLRAAQDESRTKQFEAVRYLFVEIAKELLNKIESDHLLAMRLELPTDINYLTILDIALKFELDDFLLFHRLEPIFTTLWREFEYLSPSRPFYTKSASFIDQWQLLVWHPNKFYYTPLGLFILDFAFYIMYLLMFTYFIWQGEYPYTNTPTLDERLLWVFNWGFIIYELQSIWFKKGEYFAQLSNYWDMLICSIWIVLFVMRAYSIFFPEKWITYFPDPADGSYHNLIDEVGTRATDFFLMYSSLMAVQCILLWTRLMSKLQRSNFLAPLIQMILDMLSDVIKFGILLAIFVCAFIFALHYIIAGDLNAHDRLIQARELQDEYSTVYPDKTLDSEEDEEYYLPLDSPSSIFLYVVQTLLSQQDWNLIAADQDWDSIVFFNPSRARVVDVLIIVFSVFGAILLLNLLIALMASTYERVRGNSYTRVNFYRSLNTHQTVNTAALMPPPLNILALSVAVVWLILETLIELCTCCSWTFSVEKLSPLRYSLREERKQFVTMKVDNDITAHSESDDDSETSQLSVSYTPVFTPEDSNDNMDARYISYDAGVVNNIYNEMLNQMESVEEEEQLKSPIDSGDVEKCCIFERLPTDEQFTVSYSRNSNRYCRFCRNDMRNAISGDIDKYFDLFRCYGQMLDEADIKLMKQLCNDRDHVHLCNHCFRPYKKHGNRSNQHSRRQIILEIISFYVFIVLVWIPLSILMMIPALWTYITEKCSQLSKPRAFTRDHILVDVELESKHEKNKRQKHLNNIIQAKSKLLKRQKHPRDNNGDMKLKKSHKSVWIEDE